MQAIERSFAVLRAVRGAEGSAGVSEVARATGLPKSTASRMLAALEEVGAVERVGESGGYRIGYGITSLTDGGKSITALRDTARPYLKMLTEELGESTGLVVADGSEALYMDHITSPSAVTTRDWTGMRFPFHTVAGGLAILMTWSEPSVEKVAMAGLQRFTPETVSSFSELRARLLESRRVGYVWTFGDFDTEINGVAAPVLNDEGYAVGAVSVYGPSYRFPGAADRESIGETVREAAQSVEDQIGA